MAGAVDRVSRNTWRRHIRQAGITVGLEAAYLMSRSGLLPGARGHGAIFTLHHVRPRADNRAFSPTGHLEITPEFLDAAIRQLQQDGYIFVPLDAVPDLLKHPPANGQRFASFTLDDGYRNNAEYALPVFARHGVPFTVFVNNGFAERTHSIWWETLTALIASRPNIRFDFGKGEHYLDLSTPTGKMDAFDRFEALIWDGDERHGLAKLDGLARKLGIDPLGITAELTMDPDELRKLAAEPLATLGAHTASHRALSRLAVEDALDEMRKSAAWLETLTGRPPTAIAYPYGSRRAAFQREYKAAADLGFELAVTTRPGVLSAASAGELTSLPRISLNGFYQKRRYVSALASGIPFKMASS